MKKIYYVIAAFLFLSCGDGVDLPSPGSIDESSIETGK